MEFELNAEHYILPDAPQAEWWLPPPCKRPRNSRRHLKRFTRLVKYMLTRPLRHEAHVQYDIQDVSLCQRLSTCRAKSRCFYQVTVNLGAGYHIDEDGKEALNTLKQFPPRGVQIIEHEAMITTMPDSGSESADEANVEEVTVLRVVYSVNCPHNLRLRAHAPPNEALTPAVNVQVE